MFRVFLALKVIIERLIMFVPELDYNFSDLWSHTRSTAQSWIGAGFNQVSGSGSRGAKTTHKNRKNYEIPCFEVLDVPF
jgi:hypothetical protein